MPQEFKRFPAKECAVSGMVEGKRAAIVCVVVSVDSESLRAVVSDSSGAAVAIVQVEMLKDLKEGSTVRIIGVPFFDSGKHGIEAEIVQGMAGVDFGFYKKIAAL